MVLYIILLVLFTVTMFVWFLGLMGALPGTSRDAHYPSWLAWFACLILGVVFFLSGFGVIVIDKPVFR
jgi:hypothetical protein